MKKHLVTITREVSQSLCKLRMVFEWPLCVKIRNDQQTRAHTDGVTEGQGGLDLGCPPWGDVMDGDVNKHRRSTNRLLVAETAIEREEFVEVP